MIYEGNLMNDINEIIAELNNNHADAYVEGWTRLDAGSTPWLDDGSDELWLDDVETHVIALSYDPKLGEWTGEEVDPLRLLLAAESAEDAINRAEALGVTTTQWGSALFRHSSHALQFAFADYLGDYAVDVREDYDGLRSDARPALYTDWAFAAIHCATDEELVQLFETLDEG